MWHAKEKTSMLMEQRKESNQLHGLFGRSLSGRATPFQYPVAKICFVTDLSVHNSNKANHLQISITRLLDHSEFDDFLDNLKLRDPNCPLDDLQNLRGRHKHHPVLELDMRI